MQMSTLDQKLIHALLQEIDNCLHQRVLTVNNGHLNHLCETSELFDYLLYLQKEGLISGNLISKSTTNTPHKMINIRLTNMGTRALRSFAQHLAVA